VRQVDLAGGTRCSVMNIEGALRKTDPVTLGDLIREGKLLWTYCRKCCRERDIDPATIPLPPEFPVPEAGSRMKCSACGSRKVETKPELYPGGIEAMRNRRRST
jgi:hypothetical protein